MKANRKFVRNADDDAVSPVIAVILMVAITVVLAATVYVWVSGFGAQSSTPAKSLALSSAASHTDDCNNDDLTDDYCKKYTVASASPGVKYEDLTLKIGGTELDFHTSCNDSTAAGNDTWVACTAANSGPRASTDVVSAGDYIIVRDGTTLSGVDLLILDSQANSVILTLTIS